MTIGEDATAAAELSPRRLHPASPFIGLLVQIRQLAGPLVLTLVLGRDSDWGAGPFVIGGAVVAALAQYLSWRRFSYCVRDGKLIVDKGLIQRHHREIPVDRVHHVEEVAKLQHRVFGVVNLKVDSGGGESGAEVELNALSRREAAVLRAVLEGRPDSPGPVVRRDTTAPPLLELGVGQLVVAGITNVPFATTIALLASSVQLADGVDDNFIAAAIDRAPRTLSGLAAGLAAGVLLYVLFAGAASVLSNYGYVLEREGHDLKTRRGLLDKRSAVVDLRRLTVIRLEETLMRRALGLCSLRIQTVSGGKSGVSSLSVPIVDRGFADELIKELMPVGESLPILAPHPPAARRRQFVRKLLVALVVAGPIAWFWPPTGVVVGALLLALAACRAEVSYRALGHATQDAVLVSRHGGLRRETAITTWPRSESTRLRRSPTQRWAGLATLNVDVPHGRSVSIVDADPDALGRLRQLALTAPDKP